MTAGRLRSQIEAHLVRAFGPFGLPVAFRGDGEDGARRLFLGDAGGADAAVCDACGTLVVPVEEDPREEWVCPACGVIVPGRFDTCWKCSSRRPGE
jgi:predicted RNA-binding Zn-ribbon protein involved in translation (DUF1610 family)